jgi:hypothetical protein
MGLWKRLMVALGFARKKVGGANGNGEQTTGGRWTHVWMEEWMRPFSSVKDC